MKDQRKTTSILGGAYEVVGVKPGPIGSRLGTVDLSKINEDMAERLVKAKSSYIRKVPKKQEPEKPENAQDKKSHK